MLDKNEQNISDISNSTINQANGNIINKGVSVKDVLDNCKLCRGRQNDHLSAAGRIYSSATFE